MVYCYYCPITTHFNLNSWKVKERNGNSHTEYDKPLHISIVGVFWNVNSLLMVHTQKCKQDQEIWDPCELVKFQCIKNYYNFHFFCRQDFLLFETLLSFPCCANLTFCFLITQVIFAKSNSRKGTGKAAENPLHISLIPEWHRGDMSVTIATLGGKQLGIFCSRNSL